MLHVPERYRITTGPMGSDARLGNAGAFRVPVGSQYLMVIASGDFNWEHVSVSHRARIPTGEEMCAIKDLFWGPEDVVVQYHPRESEYVRNCRNCLHLWRPLAADLPTPPVWMVGNPKDKRER